MASRRYKSATMKFGVPLSVPGSRSVERCYGFDGVGYAHPAPDGAGVELVLINAQWQLWTAPGVRASGYRTDAVGHRDGWRLLGWRITNLRNAAVAINVLEGARDACINLKPMAAYMTEQELQQRAEVIAHVIRARAKLQLLSQRADRLRGDLDRFKARRQAMKS